MTIFRGKPPALFLICIMLALLVRPGEYVLADSGRKVKIVVFMSNNSAPYEELLDGFKTGLAKQKIDPEFSVSVLQGDRGVELFEQKSTGEKPAMVLTVGSKAQGLAASGPTDVPVVAGLFLRARETRGKRNITGISMEFAFETQFQEMRQVLPHCRNIGVVYSPANADRMDEAERAAAGMGLVLHKRQISNLSELPPVLDFFVNRVDVLWGVPDELVFTPQTAKDILLYSLRNRIPLVGLSGTWTKAGALYSLEWDYKDLGLQCAELANKILGGAAPGSLPIAGPRKIVYSLNLKTASHMKLEIPDIIEKSAFQVYR